MVVTPYSCIYPYDSTSAELSMPAPPERLDSASIHTGLEEIRAAFATLAGSPVTRHATFGTVFDTDTTDPSAATGRMTCDAHRLSRRPSGELGDVVWHLRYLDCHRVHNGRWRFAPPPRDPHRLGRDPQTSILANRLRSNGNECPATALHRHHGVAGTAPFPTWSPRSRPTRITQPKKRTCRISTTSSW